MIQTPISSILGFFCVATLLLVTQPEERIGGGASKKYTQDNLDKYIVKQICKALKFARSTYYEALVRVPFNKEQKYLKFSAKVE